MHIEVGHAYKVYTEADKMVSDYANIPILEVENLSFVDYYVFLHDGYISALNETEEGRKYLEKCWVMEQKKADRSALKRRFFKK